MTRLVLASHNAHKLEELQRILGPLIPGVELIGYDGPEPVENGLSFEENALLKARAAAAYTGLPAIADDSGIAVDVLGGCPGIFSARWSGPARKDSDNVDLLLWQLSDVADEHRAASFVCAAALVMPVTGQNAGAEGGEAEAKTVSRVASGATVEGGTVAADREAINEVCELGIWPGSILREPVGDHGFGYDPVFRPEGERRSAAELSAAEKDLLSHRTRAFSALAPEIRARVS